MKVSDATREWLSVHLFFRGGLYSAAADRVILDFVAPLVRDAIQRRWVERYFFIRYGQGGPHVRLRMCGPRAVLEDSLQPLVAERAGAFASVPGGVFPKQVAYEPEFDRYGGPSGVALAEQLFHASSDAAIVFLRGLDPSNRASRLGKALVAMLVVTQAFHRDRECAAAFLRLYGTRYLRTLVGSEAHRDGLQRAFDDAYAQQAEKLTRYVIEGWLRLERGESVSAAVDPYVNRVGLVRREFERLVHTGSLREPGHVIGGVFDPVARIVPSYLHMMNNRLGVSVVHEAYLASLIRRALSVPAAEAS